MLQVGIRTTLPRVPQGWGGGALPAHTCRELRRWRKEKSWQKKWAGTCPDQWNQPDLWIWTHLIQADPIQVQAQVFQDLDPPETNWRFPPFSETGSESRRSRQTWWVQSVLVLLGLTDPAAPGQDHCWYCSWAMVWAWFCRVWIVTLQQQNQYKTNNLYSTLETFI